MASPSVKQAARELIDQLPDEATWDDISYQVELRASIERGLADSEAGRLFTQDEIEKQFGIKQ